MGRLPQRVDPERTLAEADVAQRLLDSGEAGALTGVPVALKDNLSTDGVETTCASKILKGYVPPFDATVVGKLKALGAPSLGKTNLDEFAMGTSTENSAFQLTRNPWDTGAVARWEFGRLGGGGGGGVRSFGAWLGYRRLDSAASLVVRRRWVLSPRTGDVHGTGW